jgi:ankyrin repeat protein
LRKDKQEFKNNKNLTNKVLKVKRFVKNKLSDYKQSTHETTPLIYALEHQETEVVRLLVKFGADVNLSAKGGMSPIFYSYDDAIMLFLIKSGADVYSKGSKLIEEDLFR